MRGAPANARRTSSRMEQTFRVHSDVSRDASCSGAAHPQRWRSKMMKKRTYIVVAVAALGLATLLGCCSSRISSLYQWYFGKPHVVIEEIWEYGSPQSRWTFGPKGGGVVYQQYALRSDDTFVCTTYWASLSQKSVVEAEGTWERGDGDARILSVTSGSTAYVAETLPSSGVRRVYPEENRQQANDTDADRLSGSRSESATSE
jgi:hypothetical protein